MWGLIQPPCTIQPHIMLSQARIYAFNKLISSFLPTMFYESPDFLCAPTVPVHDSRIRQSLKIAASNEQLEQGAVVKYIKMPSSATHPIQNKIFWGASDRRKGIGIRVPTFKILHLMWDRSASTSVPLVWKTLSEESCPDRGTRCVTCCITWE